MLTYGPEVIAALRYCWAVVDGPTGKRMAPVLPGLVEALRRYGELNITDTVAAQLTAMSAATIDRRLATDRAELTTKKGRSLTKPGSLLRSQIPMRTRADWDNTPRAYRNQPGRHDGGDLNGEFCYTLTCTDIATGWTETRTVRNRAATWVFTALVELQAQLPRGTRPARREDARQALPDHQPRRPAPPDRRPPRRPTQQDQTQDGEPRRQAERRLPLPGKTR
jgi:hypothetical protein